MIWLFWIAVLFCIYTYALFPLWLAIRAHSVPKQIRRPLDEYPAVSVIIAVHNEEANIPAKLASLNALDYPSHKLEIVFVSDGSTDQTVALLTDAKRTMDSLQFTHYAPAAGKPTAINKGVEMATGQVLVFMDARQSVSVNALKALTERLMATDDGTDIGAEIGAEIGAVSGELTLADDEGVESAYVGMYWRYEKWIRLNESKLFSTTGATGALYAIRKSDFQPHRADVLLDDFDTPISLLAQGKRTVFEPEARVYDKAEASVSGEFRRKSRTLAGNFQSFARHRWLFSPTKNPVFLQFLSHKVFRLMVPYAMLVALIASMLGTGWFLKLMFVLQIVFYAIGFANMAGVKALDNKIFNFIKVFLQLNVAAVVGGIRYFNGTASVRWKQS